MVRADWLPDYWLNRAQLAAMMLNRTDDIRLAQRYEAMIDEAQRMLPTALQLQSRVPQVALSS